MRNSFICNASTSRPANMRDTITVRLIAVFHCDYLDTTGYGKLSRVELVTLFFLLFLHRDQSCVTLRYVALNSKWKKCRRSTSDTFYQFGNYGKDAKNKRDFSFEGVREFGWQTVPCSCRGDGKRSVADSGQSTYTLICNIVPLSHLCRSSCGSPWFYEYFCLRKAAVVLREDRRSFMFWLRSIRFLRGLRVIFAFSCGSPLSQNSRELRLKVKPRKCGKWYWRW